MKKVFLGAATLALLSTSAYATKARLLALGDEVEDNYYTMDDRYIFTNASYINNFADMVVYEHGSEGATSYATAFTTAEAANTTLDTDQNPKAMGGFLKKHGKFTYGAYLGNESNVSSLLRIIASDGDDKDGYLATSDNQIDIFFGGQAGINWGVDFIYASSDRKNSITEKLEDSAMAIRMGVNKDNWDAYANVSLNSESENKDTGNKFDGKLGLQLGGSYTFNQNLKVYGSYKMFDWEQTQSVDATSNTLATIDGGFTRLDLGAGKEYTASTDTMVFVRAQLTKLDIEVEYSTKSELSTLNIPLIVGFESKANEWLTLRGSVSQTIFGEADSTNLGSIIGASGGDDSAGLKAAGIGAYNGNFASDGKISYENSTTVNLGATLTWNDINVDTLVGSVSDNAYTRFAVKYNF
ncbi:hypothetical protein DAY19_02595 [Halobacteriovorax vibrionivorans]|uniref:Autotransporter domain-containing protein n=1 Tax=Halobacteriovorax vibrionivorans TaxID=2152716 RepID=A0ABY0II96_9BACT|nr:MULTISPECIES: hypothetical protein [Halobacteriovorax]RZF22679.1 hypothetical protein DAY19_02595 [Halobacteriovorax vibrionivorans]TGD46700.1 hypothetical protein EP118_10980 [Halobacteriovorax sp. Y22]